MLCQLIFLTFDVYGRFIKQCAWLTAVAQSLLIIASRKHYTVDVVVAWYMMLIYSQFVYIFGEHVVAIS